MFAEDAPDPQPTAPPPGGGGRRCAGDDGGAFVELALLLPLIASLVFGTLDVGRAFALRSRLTDMAREGALYAQYHPYDVSGCSPSITSVARNEDSSVTNATVTVLNAATNTPVTSACGTPAPSGTRLRVRVTKNLEVLTPFVGIAVGNAAPVSGEIEVVTQG